MVTEGEMVEFVMGCASCASVWNGITRKGIHDYTQNKILKTATWRTPKIGEQNETGSVGVTLTLRRVHVNTDVVEKQ